VALGRKERRDAHATLTHRRPFEAHFSGAVAQQGSDLRLAEELWLSSFGPSESQASNQAQPYLVRVSLALAEARLSIVGKSALWRSVTRKEQVAVANSSILRVYSFGRARKRSAWVLGREAIRIPDTYRMRGRSGSRTGAE
jgi:hypothetical protein